MIVAVVGYANFSNEPFAHKIHLLASKMGQMLIDNGYTLATGGLGGVMRSASMGAKRSRHYTPNSILGILPGYDKGAANEYVDIALPVGFDIGRNISLISLADALIIIGGNAGTLNEISLAWQLNKLIIALGDFGWGAKLANTALDARRKDRILSAKTPSEAIAILDKNLPYFLPTPQSLVTPILSRDEATACVAKICKISQKSLKFLGQGSEGYVFTDKRRVYKIFKPRPTLQKLYFNLRTISHKLENLPFDFCYPFEATYANSNLIVSYKYEHSQPFQSASLPAFQAFLSRHYFAGVVHLDLQPKNLCTNERGEIFVCDIGADLVHFTPEFFESMCRRAFAIFKLQNRVGEIADIKQFLSPLNNEQNFAPLREFLRSGGRCSKIDGDPSGSGETSGDLDAQFAAFRKGIGEFVLHKELIANFYAKHGEISSIFDYGSGKGDIAALLATRLAKSLVCFEPDGAAVAKGRENYTHATHAFSDERSLNETLTAARNGRKFDSALCSLVLCHKLANTETARQKIITQIMQNLCTLSKSHILIVICNPLFTAAPSNIQAPRLKNHAYSQTTLYKKRMFISQNEREDTHRPLRFYENLFARCGLKVRSVVQSGDFLAGAFAISNSDFMLFDLIKEKR